MNTHIDGFCGSNRVVQFTQVQSGFWHSDDGTWVGSGEACEYRDKNTDRWLRDKDQLWNCVFLANVCWLSQIQYGTFNRWGAWHQDYETACSYNVEHCHVIWEISNSLSSLWVVPQCSCHTGLEACCKDCCYTWTSSQMWYLTVVLNADLEITHCLDTWNTQCLKIKV